MPSVFPTDPRSVRPSPGTSRAGQLQQQRPLPSAPIGHRQIRSDPCPTQARLLRSRSGQATPIEIASTGSARHALQRLQISAIRPIRLRLTWPDMLRYSMALTLTLRAFSPEWVFYEDSIK